MIFAQASANVPHDVTANWAWGLAGFAVLVGGVFWCWNQISVALGKSRNAIYPQPLAVEMTKQMHEKFAARDEFEKHVRHNTERHAQLFNEISRVERSSREVMDERMEKLSEQFTFIRENIAAINRELQIRNES